MLPLIVKNIYCRALPEIRRPVKRDLFTLLQQTFVSQLTDSVLET